MAKLIPVEGNPFLKTRLVPVEGNPFKQMEPMPSHDPVRQREPDWRQGLSERAHDYLPMIGGTVGSLVGGGGALVAGQIPPFTAMPEEAVTVPAGMAAGGAGGTAIGEQLADTLDQWLGTAKDLDLKESIAQAGDNLMEGGKAETIGLGFAHGLGGAVNMGRKLIGNQAERFVGKTLSELGGGSLKEADELAQNVPGLRYTPGMGTGNREITALERGAITSGKEGFGPVQRDAGEILQGNVQAVGRKLESFPGRTDDFTTEIARQKAAMEAERSALRGVETPGRETLQAIDEAQQPVKAAMERLESQIPNYPMGTRNAQEAASATLLDPRIPASSRNAAKDALELLRKETGKYGETTHALFGVRRSLDAKISQALRNEDNWTAGVLMDIKKGIDADFAELGAKARTGEIKVLNGKTYSPDALAQELEQNTVKAAELSAKQTPDVAAISERLGPSSMRVAGEAEDAYLKRISRDYEKRFGAVPTKGAGKELSDLQARNETLKKTLSQLEPGQDVASLLNAYNDYASTRFFDRFRTRSVKQATSAATPIEGVTAKFTTPSGSEDLIRAVGRDKAQDLMRAHYRADFSKLLDRNPTDAQLSRWFADNRRTLNRFGLDREMFEVVKSQRGYRELEKVLAADPQSLFKQILGGNKKQQAQTLGPVLARLKGKPEAINGLKKAFAEYLDTEIVKPMAAGKEGFGRVEKILKEMEPTINRLYTPAEQKALKDIQEAVKLTQRLTEGSPLGGSQTAELMNASARRVIAGRKANPVLTSIFSAGIIGTAAMEGGYLGAIAGAAASTGIEAVRAAVRNYGDDAVRKVFARAMFDPEYAQTLIKLSQARTAKGEAVKDFASKVGYVAGKYAGGEM